MTNKTPSTNGISYRDLYEFVDAKTSKIYERLDAIENQLSNMQGQQKMVPFLVSTAVGVFFTVINIVVSFIPKR